MLILNFESGTRFQDFRKNNHHFEIIFIILKETINLLNHHFGLFSTPVSLEINFLLANFLIECSTTTIRYRFERKIEY